MAETAPQLSGNFTLRGTLRALLLFDVAEEIDLVRLRAILGTSPRKREPSFVHVTPEYVRYENPPVLDRIPDCRTRAGEILSGRVRYFDYGAACIELQLAIEGAWLDAHPNGEPLVRSGRDGTTSPGGASCSHREGAACPQQTTGRLGCRGVLHRATRSNSGTARHVTAEELLRDCGQQLAQLVRGEESPLAPSEKQEVLQGSMSYYPTDLLVVGWVAAVVYDTPRGAEATVDLLEYANTQLLEFRYYDEVLTRVLAAVYKRLERRRGFFLRWRLASEAKQLNSIRLEIRELSERTDNAIKFLSDMFYARAYRLAAARIGVNDYHALVNQKLSTAGDLYDSMINEFHQGRAFVLESMVVVILIIELVYLFRGMR